MNMHVLEIYLKIRYKSERSRNEFGSPVTDLGMEYTILLSRHLGRGE